MSDLTWAEFERVELRVGTVTEANAFPEARRPAFKLTIDFGDLGTRRSSAQITDHYDGPGLVGRQVVAVLNFPPKQIGPFMSEVLTLGAYDDAQRVVLLSLEHPVPNGSRMM